MTDRPIIFSAPMIRALIEGRKTMTRGLARRPDGKPSPWQKVQPGDRLWVREGWAVSAKHDGPRTVYRQDDPDYARAIDNRWLSPLFMPRWASRLTLTILKVFAHRLNMITRADAMREGVTRRGPQHFTMGDNTEKSLRAQDAFATYWETLHGAASWRDDPEVIALTFAVERRNIDAPDQKVPD